MQRVHAGGRGRLRLHPLQPTLSGRPFLAQVCRIIA